MESDRMTSRAEEWSTEPRVRVRTENRAPTLGEVIGATAQASDNGHADGGEIERVSCPSCRTEYGMPTDLMPPWGGRVRCPRCSSAFSVGARAEADDLVSSIIS